jgi:hypothetical protein
MIFSYGKWLERIRFIALFVVLTLLLYHGMMWISQWLEPRDKYREPTGKAVKAFRQHASIPTDRGSAAERLKLFYWYGE